MKKIGAQQDDSDEESSTHSTFNLHDRIAAAAKKKHEESLKAALKRVGLKHSGGVNPAKGKPSFGSSISSKADESAIELFSMMDSFLSEKIVSMLEAKLNPDNMISPNVKLNGKTPVVASADGIPPAQYAQAQGVVMASKKQNSVNESDDGLRFEPHPDHTNYLEKEKKQVLPKDDHHAGVVMQKSMKVRNVKFSPKTREYSIGPHKGKTPEEAISTYMENTKSKNSIASHVRSGKGPVN